MRLNRRVRLQQRAQGACTARGLRSASVLVRGRCVAGSARQRSRVRARRGAASTLQAVARHHRLVLHQRIVYCRPGPPARLLQAVPRHDGLVRDRRAAVTYRFALAPARRSRRAGPAGGARSWRAAVRRGGRARVAAQGSRRAARGRGRRARGCGVGAQVGGR